LTAVKEAILTPNPIPLIKPTNVEPTNTSPYPLQPLNSNNTKAQTQGDEAGKKEKLLWTKEILEQLVNTLYKVFKKGGTANNSFKKATFKLIA
jgi:hypothetical protein